MTNSDLLAISWTIDYLFPASTVICVWKDTPMDHTLRETCDDLQARILNLRDSL